MYTSSKLRISLAQLNSGLEPDRNLTLIEAQVADAAAAGSAMVVFPEAMMRRFGAPLGEVAEPLDGPWATAVRAVAAKHGVVVVAGMFTPSQDGRVHNTTLITGPGVDAHYRKIHLYDAFGFAESDTVAPGSDPVTVTIGETVVGFATCYDIRFPALFQKLGDRGAQVIVVSASWGAGPRKAEQWELLAQARALDSTAYIVACGQADPGETLGSAPLGVGHSIVCSPTGEVLAGLGSESGTLTVDLDVSAVAEVRQQLPVLANRRTFDAEQ